MSKNVLPWILLGTAVVVFGLLIFLFNGGEPEDGGDGNGNGNNVAAADCDPRFDTQIEELRGTHAPGKTEAQWTDVLTQWDELAKEENLCARQQEAVRKHRRSAQEALDNLQSGTDVAELARDDPARKLPPATPSEEFQRYYPAGREIGSVANFDVNGQGTNANWLVQGVAHFSYKYQVVAETKVVQNAGDFAVFEVYFRDVTQLRAVSKEAVRLRSREDFSPMMDMVWKLTEKEVLESIPGYEVLKTFVSSAETYDPRFERTLTLANEYAKQAGVPLADRDDVEVVAQFEALAGKRLKVTYVRDLGVTKIEVLNGDTLPLDQLKQLAYNTSYLMDYFIFPGGQQKEGERWEVNVQDVAGVVNLELDAEATGKLVLERGKSIREQGQELIELKLVDGEVEAAFEGDIGPQTTTIVAKGGTIRYSPEMLMIRQAELNWEMTRLEVSEDHLLFGTERAQDITVQSSYEAQRLDSVSPGGGN